MNGITYLSRATEPFDNASLHALCVTSSINNERHNITGYLSYFRSRFVQYIEGNETDVALLMEKIRHDQRHDVIVEAHRDNITERVFPTWSMRYLDNKELSRYSFEVQLEKHLLCIKTGDTDQEYSRELLWKHIRLVSKIRLAGKL